MGPAPERPLAHADHDPLVEEPRPELVGVELRRRLAEQWETRALAIDCVRQSRDGTRKFTLRAGDAAIVEAVWIPEERRSTLCISTQVGCSLGCPFCATGARGFTRNLSTAEIVDQVCRVAEAAGSGDRPSNIVLMGMGEPLANYRNVIHAIHTITDNDEGLRFSTRKVTLSTAGLIPKLSDLGKDTKINLAVSLNATDNETRTSK